MRKRATFHHKIKAKKIEIETKRKIEKNKIEKDKKETGENAITRELPKLDVEEKPIEVPSSPIPGAENLGQTKQHSLAEDLHDWILGGQDGIVNVLGSILGVAVITDRKEIILVAGLASAAAESISMAAVAYTSVKASQSYAMSEREAQKLAIDENPQLQKEILIDIYERKGLSRADAHRVVTELTKDKNVWLQTMMEEHLHIYGPEEEKPMRSSFIVGFASLVGSILPIIPFFLMPVYNAIIASVAASILILFAAGAASAKLTIGDWKKRGAELAVIGTTAALVSFGIGYAFANGIITIG
jgi:predicted membrane protein (TIGR00267 family)